MTSSVVFCQRLSIQVAAATPQRACFVLSPHVWGDVILALHGDVSSLKPKDDELVRQQNYEINGNEG